MRDERSKTNDCGGNGRKLPPDLRAVMGVVFMIPNLNLADPRPADDEKSSLDCDRRSWRPRI